MAELIRYGFVELEILAPFLISIIIRPTGKI